MSCPVYFPLGNHLQRMGVVIDECETPGQGAIPSSSRLGCPGNGRCRQACGQSTRPEAIYQNVRDYYQCGRRIAFVFGVRLVWRVWQVDWHVLLVTEFSFGLFWRYDRDQNPSVYAYAMPEPPIDETRKALNDLVVRVRFVPQDQPRPCIFAFLLFN